MKKQQQQYRALVGMHTPAGRFEPGEIVRGIPPRSIPALLEAGYLEPVDEEEPEPADREEDE